MKGADTPLLFLCVSKPHDHVQAKATGKTLAQASIQNKIHNYIIRATDIQLKQNRPAMHIRQAGLYKSEYRLIIT